MPMPPVMLMEASEKKWYLPSFEPMVKGLTSSSLLQHMLVTLGPPKEHVTKMAEACIAWVGHVAAHVVDARCHLRIGLAEPDAAAERRSGQALTLEVAVALR
eukprot:scaffold7397_cov58-Phaeocystis_antarctica.AAC.1